MAMKIEVREIGTCEQCKHATLWTSRMFTVRCELTCRKLKSIRIPRWCPLPDAPPEEPEVRS